MKMNATARRPSQRFTQLAFGIGGLVASVVYGTVVVMATVTAAHATKESPWTIAAIVWSTVLVLWVAHLYAHGLSESLTEGHRLDRLELLSIARRESGILLAAVLPSAALALGAAGVLAERASVWLAIGIGLVTLGAEGVRYARLERLGAAGTLAIIASNLALGAFVVILKVIVAH